MQIIREPLLEHLILGAPSNSCNRDEGDAKGDDAPHNACWHVATRQPQQERPDQAHHSGGQDDDGKPREIAVTEAMKGLRPVDVHVGVDGIDRELRYPTGRYVVPGHCYAKEQENVGNAGFASRQFDRKLRIPPRGGNVAR